MGINIQSCCHKCRVRHFHFRGKEQTSLPSFYNRHYECMRQNPRNVETLEDQMQEAEWMNDYPEDEA